MRLPRFRIRTTMIVVAVVALFVWVGIEVPRRERLSQYYRAKATAVSKSEGMYRSLSRALDWSKRIEDATSRHAARNGKLTESGAEDIQAAAVARTEDFLAPKIEYFARLKQKYEHAARYPWLSVEPDPPEPK